ncbi:hypothetical protein LCGC14_1581880 [marine sediment metagenome]|uniref:6-pyruvoyl tetrahydrobiopterin synthase n=1 Tax=marine sediment metagenome TaxID=412755 RepID=A0A0F9KXA9_9ZZZZ
MRCIITKQIKWHMGHRVPSHKSKCRSMHGHTYHLKAEVLGVVGETEGTSDEGMVIDFGDIKTILMTNIYNVLDHAMMLWEKDLLVPALRADQATNLIEVPFIPTAENIARWCFEQVDNDLHIPGRRRLLRIVVNETPTSAAEYSPLDQGSKEDLLNE